MTSANADSTTLSATDFVKIRRNTKQTNSITTWNGTVTTAGVATDKAQTLFKILGYNIARCFQDETGQWIVASRELTFYLDPVTNEVLKTWKNPWTNETLNVVPIANALVQQKIQGNAAFQIDSAGETSILRIDVPLSYPNPLAGDSRFADYSPDAFYKAHESFSYVVSRRDLESLPSVTSLDQVQVVWTSVSPWLPWMKMKGAPGYLVFNSIVEKSTTNRLPDAVRQYLSTPSLGLYVDAPRCVVKSQPNVTSWTYFKENFTAYLNGQTYPVPELASRANSECGAQ